MTNDLSTLSGALLEMKDQLIYELGQKGVTASYDSTTGLLGLIGQISNIQTGSSCYHINFSESSYTAISGSATLEVYLQQNYEPLAGETVSVTGGGSSYTGITNNDGVASVTVTSVSAETTFTASYSNVSDTCTVIPKTYLFYDLCNSSSGLSNYGSSVLIRGSNAAITMTYDSGENAYKLSGAGNYHAMIPIPTLNDESSYVISAEFKAQNIEYNAQGFFIDNRNDTSSYGDGFFMHLYRNQFVRQRYRVSSDGSSSNTGSLSLNASNWYKIEVTVDGSSMTGKLYNGDTLLATQSDTNTINNKQIGLFLFCEKGATGSVSYVKNIKAEAL